MTDVSPHLHLGDHDEGPLRVAASSIITGRTAVIGMSGSGKSHLIGVLCEEICRAALPFVIFDPEGEYAALKEKFPVVWAANHAEADVRLKADTLPELAAAVVEQGARLVFDTSDSSNEVELASTFLAHLYASGTQTRAPILVIVEEADRFIPQSSGGGVPELLEISRRGRKRGIGLAIATQRPAMVDKNVLSQCGNQLIGRLRLQNDLNAVKPFFDSNDRLRTLPELERGHFFAMGEIAATPRLFLARARETTHQGRTPDLRRRRSFSVEGFVTRVADDPPGDSLRDRSSAVDPPTPIAAPATPESPLTAPPAAPTSRSAGAAAPAEVDPSPADLSPEANPVPAPTRARESRGGPQLTHIPFVITPEETHHLAERQVARALLTRSPQESIESIEALFWPFQTVRYEVSKRGVFGLDLLSVTAVWDAVLGQAVRFKNNQIQVLQSVDRRILGLSQGQQRALMALRKDDLSAHDLAAALGQPIDDVKRDIQSLRRRKLVTPSGKAGRSHLYRPLIELKAFSIKDLQSPQPETRQGSLAGAARVLPPRFAFAAFQDLILAMHDEGDVFAGTFFHFPRYLISLRHKKSQARRVILLNGLTAGTNTVPTELLDLL